MNTSTEVPSGVYIAFAARDGQVAADGDYNGYSLYTRELLKNIEIPNERLEDIFIRTRIAVKNETKNKQFPIDYGSIDGRFYFKFEEQNLISSSGNMSDRIKKAEEFFKEGLKCSSTDYDCKISNYSKAINLNPNYTYAYNNRGLVYRKKQNYNQAIQDYTKAIEINPKNAVYYRNRAIVYDTIGEKDKTQADRKKADELEKP